MNEYTVWIINMIKLISTRFKARASGEKSTRNCLAHMADELGKWSDRVIKDSFVFRPRAFIGSIALMAFLDICAVACIWAAYLFGLKVYEFINPALYFLSICLLVFEFALYRKPFDFLFPRRASFNVFSEIKARKETRRRVILCGHADAAYEMRLLTSVSPTVFILLAAAGLTGMIVFLVLGIVNAAGAKGSGITLGLCVAQTAFLPAYVPWFFFADWDIVTDGANDDLTGCCIAMSIMKEMHEKGERLEHTDVCCLITDGEESGLRGASAFAQKHRDELADSIVIAVDTIHDEDALMVYHRGINFTRKNSEKVCELIKKAGMECGVDMRNAGFYPGANDADAFSREGVEAAAICAIPHRPPEYYHTRKDTWENLEPKSIELTREILKRLLKLADEK